jgi:hypothetical protein
MTTEQEKELFRPNYELPHEPDIPGVIRIQNNSTQTTIAKQSINLFTPVIRQFETGATRDLDIDKVDYEACLSPLVLEAFGEYMLSCTIQKDGSKRPGDNWQKGIPLTSYMKSLLRHTWDVWKLHRGYPVIDRKTGNPVTMKQACCAVMFNIMGYLHEYLKEQNETN